MPSVSRLPFEAHPISIASLDSVFFASDAKVAKGSEGKELVFVGVKNGFTRRLKEIASRGERVKVYIDGPYGGGANFGCHDTSLLIAGTFLTWWRRFTVFIIIQEGQESRLCYQPCWASSSSWLTRCVESVES